MNSADTSFMFLSTILVMLMTPGLAMFYGGMVKTKKHTKYHNAQLCMYDYCISSMDTCRLFYSIWS